MSDVTFHCLIPSLLCVTGHHRINQREQYSCFILTCFGRVTQYGFMEIKKTRVKAENEIHIARRASVLSCSINIAKVNLSHLTDYVPFQLRFLSFTSSLR